MYRAIHELLEFELADQNPTDDQTSLGLFFDQQTLADTTALASRQRTFHELHFAASWEEISQAHRSYLKMYERLHPLKREAW